jgi:hypothetical protein
MSPREPNGDDQSQFDENTHRLWRMGTAPQSPSGIFQPISSDKGVKDYVLKA